MGTRGTKPGWQKQTAKERIEILLKEAENVFDENPERAHEYVKKARTIGMRYRIRLPKEFRRRICRNCYHYLKPGVNCTVRLSQKRQSKKIVTCKDCGEVMRYPYKDS